MRIPDTMAFLLGYWRFQRTINDYHSGIYGTVTGTAEFQPSPPDEVLELPNQFHYQEAGELQFGDAVSRITRGLRYVGQPDGSATAYFLYGERYVDLDLRSGDWNADHPCVNDLYEITTTVLSANVFQEEWRVQGPAKDYFAVTKMTRASPQG